jgi:hypothetical protein
MSCYRYCCEARRTVWKPSNASIYEIHIYKAATPGYSPLYQTAFLQHTQQADATLRGRSVQKMPWSDEGRSLTFESRVWMFGALARIERCPTQHPDSKPSFDMNFIAELQSELCILVFYFQAALWLCVVSLDRAWITSCSNGDERIGRHARCTAFWCIRGNVVFFEDQI